MSGVYGGFCLSPKASTDFPEEVGNRIRLLVPFGHQRQNLNRHAIYHRGTPPETPIRSPEPAKIVSIYAIIGVSKVTHKVCQMWHTLSVRCGTLDVSDVAHRMCQM